MAYVLYVTRKPRSFTDEPYIYTLLYLSKKAALRHVNDAELVYGKSNIVWRLRDFSRGGGWCDGNTTESFEGALIAYGGEVWE